MADNTFHLEIITPGKTLLSDEIVSFEAPGTAGEFQVLAEHTPFLSGLKIGVVTYEKGEGKKGFVSISGGFCEVKQSKAVILAHTAETPDKIDVERAREAEGRAKNRLESKNPDTDLDRAEAALKRALNRLAVAQMK